MRARPSGWPGCPSTFPSRSRWCSRWSDIDLHHIVEAAGIVVFGVLFYSYTYDWLRPGSRWGRFRAPVIGGFFGGLSIVLMISRIQIGSDVYIDARTVPIAIITVFEGWPTGIIAILPPAVYRLWRGGAGAPAGVLFLAGVLAVAGLVHGWLQRDGRLQARHALGLMSGVFFVTFGAYAMLGRYGLELFDSVWAPYVATYAIGIGVFTRLFYDVRQRARLAAERERFREIIDAASDAIRIVDPGSMRIIDCNRADCTLSWYPRESMIGRDVRDFWPTEPDLRREREAEQAEIRSREFSERFGKPYRPASGVLVRIDATHRIVEHGGRRYEIVVFRNASDREAAESARREASELRAVNLLANAAAHEINNPLAVVIGSLDLLARHLPSDGREGRLIGQAQSAGSRITDIVGRMKRITHIHTDPPRGMLPEVLDIKKSSESNGPEIE